MYFVAKVKGFWLVRKQLRKATVSVYGRSHRTDFREFNTWMFTKICGRIKVIVKWYKNTTLCTNAYVRLSLLVTFRNNWDSVLCKVRVEAEEIVV
jgi:hypothetical protein